MKKLLIVLCSVALFLILPIDTSIAREWDFKTTYDSNKAWNVSFNMNLDEKTVNSSNIYVKDGKEIHPTTPVLKNSGKTVEVQPNSSYKKGKIYYLYVTTNVKNSNGKPLKESVEMPFIIGDAGSTFQTIQSVTSHNITALTIVTNNDVFDVKINKESLRYKGNNVYEYVLIGSQPGDKITINAYDEKNKVIEKIEYIIGE